MKKILCSVTLMMLLFFPLSLHAESAMKEEKISGETSLRLLTANIWGDYFGNPVEMRDMQFVETFEKYRPDVIGMQEVTANWHKSRLFDYLEEHYHIINEFDGISNNYVPLAYKKDAFDLLDCGFQQYSQTTDNSKAYTFAVLKNKENGQVFAVCNTHFWWKSGAEHDAIRMVNAQELVACMQSLHAQYTCPVFALGDLNCSAYAGPFQCFSENNIIRLRDVAKTFSKKSSHHGDPKLGKDGLYHGNMPKNPEVKSLDHIIGLGGNHIYEVLSYQVILDQTVLDASDHSPVYADVVLYATNAE